MASCLRFCGEVTASLVSVVTVAGAAMAVPGVSVAILDVLAAASVVGMLVVVVVVVSEGSVAVAVIVVATAIVSSTFPQASSFCDILGGLFFSVKFELKKC